MECAAVTECLDLNILDHGRHDNAGAFATTGGAAQSARQLQPCSAAVAAGHFRIRESGEGAPVGK